MNANEAQSVAESYHRGWTNKHFDDAIELLAADIKVEVPINDYPTRQSFAQALKNFGSMVEHVELLAEFADSDEAMLLYDMTVQGIGKIRIAEHFTVKSGKITRLRQIHDTAPIRAFGLEKEI